MDATFGVLLTVCGSWGLLVGLLFAHWGKKQQRHKVKGTFVENAPPQIGDEYAFMDELIN